MGKPDGFLEFDRRENERVKAARRLENYEEFYLPLKEEDRRKQASRCMNCGVPYCQSAIEIGGMVTGCPLHNLIPEWNDEIFRGNYAHALSRLLKTNPFPEFTGRVCPALCEKACINGLDGQSVTIHDNEKFIIETAFEKGWMKPHVPGVRTDKKVAVIGAGPAGLAAAHDLNRRGHNVAVFEREERAGGLLMYGIPNMKLDKSVIERRIDLLKEEGIEFVFGADLGNNVSFDALKDEFDAILLAIGSKRPRSLGVDNDQANGIYYAVDYLSSVTDWLVKGGEPINAEGKNVIIVGGGDTGNDCTGTALRQGAASVIQLEMMPEPSRVRLESNPWPQWPKVLKTDYGQEEAIFVQGSDPRIYSTTIKSIREEDGQIKAVETVKVKFENGSLIQVEGSEAFLECDMLLIAAGFTGVENYAADETGLDLTGRHTFLTAKDSYKAPNEEKVFAAGDCRRGQSLVVWAISEGKNAAREIDHYLMGYSNII